MEQLNNEVKDGNNIINWKREALQKISSLREMELLWIFDFETKKGKEHFGLHLERYESFQKLSASKCDVFWFGNYSY